MKTKLPPPSADRGFTLIEVLVAMVIFAVGLLGLEALGVGAVRSLGLAERNSRAAAIGSLYLEEALQRFDTGATPAQLCETLPGGEVVSRAVDVTNPRLPQVIVTVTPDARGMTPRSSVVRSQVFRPNPVASPTGHACS